MGYFDNFLATRINKQGATEVGGKGLLNFGDTQYSSTKIDSRDMSRNINFAPTYSFGSSGVSGASLTTKKEASVSTSSSQSQEKPLSFAPALIGGGSTTATGQAEASSGLDIVPLVAVGGLVFLGMIFIGGKKK